MPELVQQLQYGAKPSTHARCWLWSVTKLLQKTATHILFCECRMLKNIICFLFLYTLLKMRDWINAQRRLADHVPGRIFCTIAIRTQVAQLSQRDRAAWWVSYGQKWKTVNGRQYFTDIRSVFDHYDVIGQQSNRIRWKKRKIRAITSLKVIQGDQGRYQSKASMRLPISD